MPQLAWVMNCAHSVVRVLLLPDKFLRASESSGQSVGAARSRRWLTVITKRGRPVAKLVPYVAPTKKNSLAGSVLQESVDPFGTGERWDADRARRCAWSLLIPEP
jgi:hypothetical protein